MVSTSLAASIVSHDLRSPLNVAQGRADPVRETYESDDLALDRCQALIDDLLLLARDGDDVGDLELIDPGSFAQRCWKTVGTDDATLDVVVAQRVRGDRSRLQQLLENPFRNVVGRGSTGSQNAEHFGDDAVRVTLGALPDGFYVADDGPGIDPEAVFETGYSTKPDGAGFALDIVAQVAEAHGWSVDVTESESGGARFEVRGVAFADG